MKQTEIGLIPEDWEVVNFEEITTENKGIKIGPFGSQLKKELLIKKGFKVYGQENVYANDFNLGDRFLSNEHFNKLKSCEVKDGDFLISMMGTIGKCAIVPPNINSGIIDSHLIRIRFNNKIYGKYILQLFNSELITIQIKRLSVGGIMDGLSSRIVKQLSIPLPPLAEQEAIANALSDADAWIEKLEQLIAKKRLIKQGAMQTLLTPKEDWEVKKLGEVCQEGGLIRGPFGGALKKEFFVKKGFKVYEQKNAIYKSVDLGNYYIDLNKFKELSRFEIREDDFILSCSGTIGKLYRIPKVFEKGIINQALLIIRLNNSLINHSFFNHIFQYDTIQAKIIDDTQGGAMKNLVGMSEFRNTEIPLPSLSEQERIAKILSDMDAEIEVLDQQLEKARQIKQGMMQELLTGRTRLV